MINKLIFDKIYLNDLNQIFIVIYLIIIIYYLNLIGSQLNNNIFVDRYCSIVFQFSIIIIYYFGCVAYKEIVICGRYTYLRIVIYNNTVINYVYR